MRIAVIGAGNVGQAVGKAWAAKGHTVEISGDVATALEVANQQKVDLLISDLGLPDGSGHDLMRARGHRFPAVTLSGYGQEEDIRWPAGAVIPEFSMRVCATDGS